MTKTFTADEYYELAYQQKKLAEDTADERLHKLYWDTSEALASAGRAAGQEEALSGARESVQRIGGQR